MPFCCPAPQEAGFRTNGLDSPGFPCFVFDAGSIILGLQSLKQPGRFSAIFRVFGAAVPAGLVLSWHICEVTIFGLTSAFRLEHPRLSLFHRVDLLGFPGCKRLPRCHHPGLSRN